LPTQEVIESTAGFRLSPQQEHLWRTSPDGPRLAVRCVLDLNDAEPRAIRDALDRIVSRHEILRTTFVRRQGLKVPSQLVNDRLEIGWEERDIDAGGNEAQAGALGEGPIVCAVLGPSLDGHRLLELTIPAVCSDAGSLVLLASELQAELGGGARGATEPVQYADYAEWRSELTPGENAGAEDAWEVADLPASPELPFVSHVEPGALPVREAVQLDEALVARGAAACGVPEAIFVEACWHASLARLSVARSVLVGAVLDGRLQDELADAVGPYAQVLPLVSTIDDGTSIAEVADQLRRARARLEQRQDTADAAVLEEVAARCEVGFSQLELPSAGVEELVGAPAPFLAHLCLFTSEGGARAELHVAPALADSGTARLLARTLAAIVASAASDISVPVSALSLTPEDASSEELALFVGDSSQPVPGTATELFEAAAARAQDSVAVVAPDATLTYAQLLERVNGLAGRLRELGVERNTPVALCMERSASSIVGLLAVLKAGGAYVPLNFEHPAARLAHQLEETKTSVLLTETSVGNRLPDFGGTVLVVDGDPAALQAGSEIDLRAVNEPDDLAYVMYTSGSTGTPKGVCVTHRNLVTYVAGVLDRLELADPAGVAFAAVTALSTDLGNTSVFPALLGGGTLHLIAPGDAVDSSRFAAYLRSHAIDVLKITPTQLRALLDGDQTAAILPKRWLVLGGEASSWQLVERLQEAAPTCRILNHYGPTETTVGTCTFEVGTAEPAGMTVPIGRPLPRARAYVVDGNLRLLPRGVPGELCIGGDGVASGYLAQPEQTDERFLPDPFAGEPAARIYRTGDRVRALADGNLEFLGRVDDQVKIRGYRIEPGEVQSVLGTHPAVRQCAVVARESGDDHELVAYVVPQGDASAEDLRAFLGESLPAYMVPAKFVTLTALPLTASGKIDRRALPDPAEFELGAEYVAPRTPLEEELARIWADLLGVEKVGVNDDFFALGGHSLLATQAVIRIRNTIADIELHSIFDHPTVAMLADAIVAAELSRADADPTASDQAS
jgi:amino acid adenylation domain-containing protein